ncbi:Cys-tRNA(Pro) deacylase [Aestuariibacter salexigens]|uniref:Cys-tRNA(Pro) deacylase n=1 Tax=Aestuariibacter salexigens TaxID=226010 RepID=UPI0004285BE9|nr:Cys-tRNA(Pro) deacylase [Aestuariibacter salexigens]
MTPAINQAKQAKLVFHIHEYAHDAGAESYGLEAAEKLGIDQSRVFKTLVVQIDSGELVVGIIPVASKLSMKHIAKAAGTKKAKMAQPDDVERATGYVLGGVSPLGQKKRLPTFIDMSAQSLDTIYVSAGRRGLEIELAPEDLRNITKGRFCELAQ